MSGGRLSKRTVFGNLEGAVRRGRGGKEKEWTNCVQSDFRAFGITGDWKATALEAEVWVETVAEGGRRFMAARRKEEVDAAGHRQEKKKARDWERVVIAHGSVESCEATPIGRADVRRTETCVAPRHVDASRDFYLFYFILFSPNEQRAREGGGGRGGWQPFLFCFFHCSADHERD